MISSRHTKLFAAAWIATGILFVGSLSRCATGQDGQPNHEPTNVIVIVKEAATGEPVTQARVTLQFSVPREHGLGGGRKYVYNAKTDMQGRCKLSEINKGKILLTVTAPGHQSFGKELQLDQDNQVFEVKLKKPQPLL
jgi:hypothetical protein